MRDPAVSPSAPFSGNVVASMGAKAAGRSLPNALCGWEAPPSEKELTGVLGPCRSLWDELLVQLADDLKLTSREWGTSSPKLGWSLRIKRGDRIIVYLAPVAGSFRASFALGDKAVQTALASKLPLAVKQSIRNAKKYAEGTAVRIDVSGADDLAIVGTLAEAKLRN
jgi:hypothetical protein